MKEKKSHFVIVGEPKWSLGVLVNNCTKINLKNHETLDNSPLGEHGVQQKTIQR